MRFGGRESWVTGTGTAGPGWPLLPVSRTNRWLTLFSCSGTETENAPLAFEVVWTVAAPPTTSIWLLASEATPSSVICAWAVGLGGGTTCRNGCRKVQSQLSTVHDLGAELIAISPQLKEHSRRVVEERALTFDVLSDPGNQVALCFGIVFELPDDLREQHLNLGLDLAEFNGDESWTLPQPSRFIIDQAGRVRYASVDFDISDRVKPDAILKALRGVVA